MAKSLSKGNTVVNTKTTPSMPKPQVAKGSDKNTSYRNPTK